MGQPGEGVFLDLAAGYLAGWQNPLPRPMDQPSYELSTLMLTGRLLTEAALMREESRGAHYRVDYPDRNDRDWLKNVLLKKEGEEMKLSTVPVKFPLLQPEMKHKPSDAMKGSRP